MLTQWASSPGSQSKLISFEPKAARDQAYRRGSLAFLFPPSTGLKTACFFVLLPSAEPGRPMFKQFPEPQVSIISNQYKNQLLIW